MVYRTLKDDSGVPDWKYVTPTLSVSIQHILPCQLLDREYLG